MISEQGFQLARLLVSSRRTLARNWSENRAHRRATLDYQDSQMDVLTHNGTPIIPAVIAMAERVSAPWRDIATAIIAGYEVHTRLLRTIQPRHWYAGFQGLGTFGTCGAATAAGRLR